MRRIAKKRDVAMLSFLYRTSLGRALLKPLTCRFVSKLAGAYMESRASARLIPSFIKKNGIDLEDYVVEDWRSFNEFFCRRIKPEARPIERDPNQFVAPCDGLLTVYPIQNDLVLPVKQSKYSIPRLLENPELAKRYNGGLCLVFRLCVTHYHRYGYVETGRKSANVFISGKLKAQPCHVYAVRIKCDPAVSHKAFELLVICAAQDLTG